MQHTWFQSVKYYTGMISLGVLLGLGLQFAQAWSNPSQSAPNGNVDGPINLGAGTQVKTGSLGLTGNLAVATTTQTGFVELTQPQSAGAVCSPNGKVARDNTGRLLSCLAGIWKFASEGTPGSGVRWCAVNDLCGMQPIPSSYFGVCVTDPGHIAQNRLMFDRGHWTSQQQNIGDAEGSGWIQWNCSGGVILVN